MSQGKKKGRGAIVAIVLVAFVFVGIPVYRYVSNSNKAIPAVPLAPVLAEKASVGTINDSLHFSGIITAQSTIALVPKIAGRLIELRVREGQRVEAGEVIARIEDTVVRLQMEQAKAGLDAAQAQRAKAVRGVRPAELENAKASLAQAEKDVEAAKSTFSRTAKLYQSGGVPKSKYEEAENAIRQAEVQVENARRGVKLMEEGASREDLAMAGANEDAIRAQYELARLQLDWAVLKAPVGGIVAKVMVKEGNMAAPGNPLVAIVQDSSVVANIALPEKHYGRIVANPTSIRAIVSPISYGGKRTFNGLVTSVGETIDAQSRTFLVEAAVSNPSRALKSGMYCTVELVLASYEGSLLIPMSSLVTRGGREGVFVLDSGERPIARFVPVTVGVRRDSLAQVVSGILRDDLIVFKGNAFLENGQQVAYSPSASLGDAALPAAVVSSPAASGADGKGSAGDSASGQGAAVKESSAGGGL